jgi:hypothetical protein
MREGPAAQFGASAPAREAEFAAAVKAWVRARGMGPTVGERTGCSGGGLTPKAKAEIVSDIASGRTLANELREVGQAR